MIGNIKSAIELMAQWRKAGDIPYQAVAGLGSMLAIASIVLGHRPSELLSSIFDVIGLGVVTEWLGTEAPHYLLDRSSLVQVWSLAVVPFAYLAMVMATYTRRHEYASIEDAAASMMNCRAAATAWLAILVAVQQGSITVYLRGSLVVAGRLIPPAIVAAIIAGAVVLIGRQLGSREVSDFVTDRVGLPLVHLAVILGAALGAIASVPLKVPSAVAGWLLDPESETHRDARERVCQRRIRVRVPSELSATRRSSSLSIVRRPGH